jgi:hypothetical protein
MPTRTSRRARAEAAAVCTVCATFEAVDSRSSLGPCTGQSEVPVAVPAATTDELKLRVRRFEQTVHEALLCGPPQSRTERPLGRTAVFTAKCASNFRIVSASAATTRAGTSARSTLRLRFARVGVGGEAAGGGDGGGSEAGSVCASGDGGGRAPRERIACIARCCPRDLGWPFSASSLSKLREVLHVNGIAEISRETLRKILKSEGVSWQAVKTWKAGRDPREFAVNAKIRLPDYLPKGA